MLLIYGNNCSSCVLPSWKSLYALFHKPVLPRSSEICPLLFQDEINNRVSIASDNRNNKTDKYRIKSRKEVDVESTHEKLISIEVSRNKPFALVVGDWDKIWEKKSSSPAGYSKQDGFSRYAPSKQALKTNAFGQPPPNVRRIRDNLPRVVTSRKALAHIRKKNGLLTEKLKGNDQDIIKDMFKESRSFYDYNVTILEDEELTDFNGQKKLHPFKGLTDLSKKQNRTMSHKQRVRSRHV